MGCGQSDHHHSHDDDHSHAEGDHHHAEGDIDDHDKELKAAEPVVEASQPEPPTAKAPDISIHEAAAKGNIEAVKQHLADGADVNLKMSSDGSTALNHAAWHGHMEVIQLLLENGVNANAKRNDGWAPLHDAVYKGHKEIVELLIANGADMNAKFDGKTPLDYANNEVAKILINHGAKTSDELKADERKLVDAARDGDIQKIKSYLAIGIDVNTIDEDGHIPLHWNVNNEIVRLLIAKGANVNAISKHGRTPLDFAIMRGQEEAVETLRKHGGKTGEELKAEGKQEKQCLLPISTKKS